MVEKLEISIEIIAHATEDVKKILEPFLEDFEIPEEEFDIQNLTGHFDNPITVIRAKIKKNNAKKLLEKLISKIPDTEFSNSVREIDSHLQDSTLHLRFGKQDLLKGKLTVQEKDAIKFKIFTPIYKKTEISKNYVMLLTEMK